ncbi:MAG TPA: Crp/Fnr family transcriptional regulator [Pyrinomonadaceae bacterium]
MTTDLNTTTQNWILTGLPEEERERLSARLEPVELALGDVIFRPEEMLQHVYFPTTAVISLLTDLEDGSGVEVGLVGYDGLAGVSALSESKESKLATIQHTGQAFKLRAATLREEFGRGGVFQRKLLRYIHALMSQISQSVVCNVRHKVEQRMIRWLLMHHDRVGKDDFKMTQEFIAAMLGVRRASVTEVAQQLQEAGMIDYHRGHIRILDRHGMERRVCECYGVVKAELGRRASQ